MKLTLFEAIRLTSYLNTKQPMTGFLTVTKIHYNYEHFGF